ncbi:hypothetical protein Mevan_0119 [Methanococcus vannielii SB]|uniref:Phosphoribosyltransferase n=1 Tax=Methanococcus vannielii (strain ATCC 35089 / DSM 1224 / JCM 13029 / OCM 148 / SB) TaxID=406327 RepID=A6UNF9_METVS|nr:hypothetical protein [Methanococcus vannielii]ABR54031.1 hypothetical protein Mevan_0119 [Methanococcus vannielii SB]
MNNSLINRIINGNNYLLVSDYYNLDEYYDIEFSDLRLKTIISEFKHCKYQKEAANLVSRVLIERYEDNINKYCFVTVPCSNRLKTEKKYNGFSKIVSSITGMENGHDFIIRYKDSKPKYGFGFESLTYYSIELDIKKINNKKIVLFDDFICSGNTVNYIKKRLSWFCKDLNFVFLEKKV